VRDQRSGYLVIYLVDTKAKLRHRVAIEQGHYWGDGHLLTHFLFFYVKKCWLATEVASQHFMLYSPITRRLPSA
jgi:hypothetical protein